MSTNKNKYWEVTTTRVVRANNKADALAVAANRKPVGPARLLSKAVSVLRISASEAHYLVDEMAE